MNYAKRKDQLDHILKDESYWTNDNGYKDFVVDMYAKVKNGYTLSSKQETAITNAVKTYAKYFFKKNDPDNKNKIIESVAEKFGNRIEHVININNTGNTETLLLLNSSGFL